MEMVAERPHPELQTFHRIGEENPRAARMASTTTGVSVSIAYVV